MSLYYHEHNTAFELCQVQYKMESMCLSEEKKEEVFTVQKRNRHRRPTSYHSTTTTPRPTSAELTTRQHSSNKTTPQRLDSSSSSYHNDSKTAIQTTTMIPTLSSSIAWLRDQQTRNQPRQKEQEKKGINTQLSWQTVASVGPPKTHHRARNQFITPQQLTE